MWSIESCGISKHWIIWKSVSKNSPITLWKMSPELTFKPFKYKHLLRKSLGTKTQLELVSAARRQPLRVINNYVGNNVNKPSTNMTIDQINQQVRETKKDVVNDHFLIDLWVTQVACGDLVIQHDRVAFTRQWIAAQVSTIIIISVCVCVCVLWVKNRKYVRSILSTTTTACHNIRSLSTIHLIRPKLYPRSRNIQQWYPLRLAHLLVQNLYPFLVLYITIYDKRLFSTPAGYFCIHLISS